VGLPKAASSTLQREIFCKLPGIRYHALSKKGGSEEEDSPLGRLITAFREGAFLDDPRPAFSRWFAQERSGSGTHLVSEERFANHLGVPMGLRGELLHDLFGDAHILMMLRRPVDLATSNFFQLSRMERYGLAIEPSINRWVEEGLRRPDHHLSPAQFLRFSSLAEDLADRFGDDKVTLLPMEWLRKDKGALAAGLASWSGVAAEDVAAVLAGMTPQNQRAAAKRSLREVWAARASKNLKEENREKIRRLAAPGIKRLEERFGLQLRELGYY
jgi:hypothetical protein